MKALAIWWRTQLIVCVDGRTAAATAPDLDTSVQTLVDLVKSDFPEATTIRLLYQPSDLQTESTTCPMGGRKAIQRALLHDYPALEQNVVAWAAQSPIATDTGAATYISIERVPRLARLRDALSSQGVIIEAAFPLLSWIERLPAFTTRGQALAVLHADHLSLIYARDEHGGRHVYQFDELAEERTREIVSTQVTQIANPPTISIISATDTFWKIPVEPAPALFKLTDFCAEAWNIPARDTSNFLPPESPITPSLVATVLGGVLAFSALLFIAWHEIDVRRVEKEQIRKTAQLEDLKNKLSEQNGYHKVITEAARLAADIGQSPKGLPTLLQVLEQMLPREVDITAIKVSGDSFTIEGMAYDGSSVSDVGPYFRFYDALADSARPWKITTPKPPTFAGPKWSITGVFTKL